MSARAPEPVVRGARLFPVREGYGPGDPYRVVGASHQA